MGIRALACSSLPFLLGCAPALVRVDDGALRRVPPADLAKAVERDDKQVAEARAELKRADDEILAARRADAGKAAERRGAEEETRKARAALDAAKKAGDARAVDQAQLDLVIAEEGERLWQAKAAWLDAQLAWRERFRDAAEKRIAAAEATREKDRAELAAKAAPVDEPFDPAPYRGQQGRLHRAWSDALQEVAKAHAEVDKRAGELAAAKQRYATARKVVLPPPLIAADGNAPAPTAPAPAPPAK